MDIIIFMKVYSYRIKAGSRKPSKASKSKPSGSRIRFPKFKKPRRLWTFIFRVFALGVVLVAALFLYYAKDLPDPNKLLEREVAESTKIFDREGGLLYEIHGEAKRTLIGLEQIPNYAKQATIAIEDKDFYKHHGLYFRGIARSILRYIVNLGPEGGGGSTLTQQFVKNAILNNKKTFGRKIPEAILSLEIEARFSKEDILKLYLNEIPYGRNAYGIEAAAQSYFGKSARNLSLAESAYLAALPQAPTFYNPLGPNRSSLDARKNRVLTAMREQGYINEETEKQAKEAKVEFLKTKTALLAPHFVLMVQDYLAKKYGEKTLAEGGLKVYTTLDPGLQKIAEAAVKQGVEENTQKYNGHNAGLVAIDPKTGQILALVGSKDYFAQSFPEGCTPGKTCQFEPNVNVALSQLQPGSSFKPFVYATAFGRDIKFSPATLLFDVITVFGKVNDKDYAPQDYDGKERGPLSVRASLAGSLNIPAVKVLALVGVDKAVQTARDLGITSPMQDCGLALVLGGCEVRLIDHVAAYAALANGGVRNEKTPILKILGPGGNTLEEYKDNPKEILDPQAVYQLISIMTDNNARSFIFGPNSPLTLPDRTVAAKTGTTQNWHDGWTLGFTPSLAAGVWAGNNNGEFLKKGADGVLVATPIWQRFMKEALKDKPAEEFPMPPGITKLTVDALSGLLPTANTPSTKEEIFADYNQPNEFDNVHITLAYDSLTNEPASPSTPPERIVYKAFTVLRSEQPQNPDWENAVRAWAIKNGYTYPTDDVLPMLPESGGNEVAVKISQPRDGAKIETSPFKVLAEADGSNPIARVDLFIDGQFYQSLNAAPFEFEFTKSLTAGAHTLAAKAIDAQGKSQDTSINFTFGSPETLLLTSPKNDTLALPPILLAAESGKKYEKVNFYYLLDGTQAITLIDAPQETENVGGRYRYSLKWEEPPKDKVFRVFAKTSEGMETNKIKITVP